MKDAIVSSNAPSLSLSSSLSSQQQAAPVIVNSSSTTNSTDVPTRALYPFFPKGLEPDHEHVILGLEVSVPATNIVFKRWKGKPIKDDMAGKPVVEYEGKPMFAELAIVKMAVRSGWSAFWQKAYPVRQSGPYYYSEWREDVPRKDQVTSSSLNSAYQEQVQASIARYNGNSFRGCWEVIAWNKGRTLYMKSMQSKKDTIRDNQVRWFSASLSAGLRRKENFLVVNWQFEDY
ncbi:hypothetical protein NTE_00227 [Candidatus Nitrososphaera evergladensis SR1]|uniref:Uncharacterized protein n=1 Tax=Candidatus Nitrososphaera evergladensis SR1 TaxID=1459636 RepID=A0A075MSI6_9ARCH|nr:hypothetical protein [Candidatus Nitrososphaera evergladensis]AIF82309.1 hypothetical protein NTE_00227 [Candidatus Nitrososphaera evergladensis SR1]